MLKLLLFTPCEKVIVSQEENSGSLISTLQGFTLTVQPPTDGQVVFLPMTWYAYALWELTGQEPARVQRFELVSTTNQILAHGELPIPKPGEPLRRFNRAYFKIAGFPISGPPGDYTLRLLMRRADEDVFAEVATYPIPITVAAPGDVATGT
jgi:hypothetical protein